MELWIWNEGIFVRTTFLEILTFPFHRRVSLSWWCKVANRYWPEIDEWINFVSRHLRLSGNVFYSFRPVFFSPCESAASGRVVRPCRSRRRQVLSVGIPLWMNGWLIEMYCTSSLPEKKLLESLFLPAQTSSEASIFPCRLDNAESMHNKKCLTLALRIQWYEQSVLGLHRPNFRKV